MGRSLDISLRNHSQARRNGFPRRDFPGAVRRRGNGLHRIRDHHRGAFARGRLDRHHRRRAQFALHQPHLQIRHAKSSAKKYVVAAGPGQEARLLVAHRTRSWLRRRRHAHHGAQRRAAAGSSTARKRSPPTVTTPTFASPWPSRTRRKSTTAFPPSSSRRELPAFARARKKTSSACARATQARSYSPIAASRPKIFWAARAKASSTACKFSTAAAFRSRRSAWAWRRAPTNARCATPSSASSSARPSRNFRPSSSSSRTWPRKSKPRAC